MRTAHKVVMERSGITLIFKAYQRLRGHGLRQDMFRLFAIVARYFSSPAEATPISPALALMETADARAGVDAHHAQALRSAAGAWLNVVR